MDISSIDLMGIERVLKRGTGKILEDKDGVLLVSDSVSGAFFLACDDVESGIAVLGKYAARCDLLMTTSAGISRIAVERYGFKEMLECYQVAYFGEKPVEDGCLEIRVANKSDLPTLTENYNLIGPEEMAEVIEREVFCWGITAASSSAL